MSSHIGHAGLDAALSAFVSSLTLSELPPSALHAGRRTVANATALSAGASHHPALLAARRALARVGADVPSPAGHDALQLGTKIRSPAREAALINGMAAHVDDFDDTHLATVVHPGAPVVPAALAMAEICDASGAEFLAGVVAGVEVAARVGLALGNDHFDRGWHLTGTAGHIGAAAAAARVARLDPARTRSALAIGATQAAGLQEALGTMMKCFHAGKAAADGVEAAMLAAEGLSAPAAPLEGARGLLALMTAAADPARALTGLGSTWEIELNAFKPYACGIVSHPVIDAGVVLGDTLGRDPSVVEAVEVTTNPIVLDVMGVRNPGDGLQSKFSVYHCFAVGYLDGAAGPTQFSDSRAISPDVVALRDRVTVTLDPSIRRDECRALVRTSGGVRTHHVSHATGSAACPMTDVQLRDKAVLVAGLVLTEAGAADLFDAAMKVDDLPRIEDLVRRAMTVALGS